MTTIPFNKAKNELERMAKFVESFAALREVIQIAEDAERHVTEAAIRKENIIKSLAQMEVVLAEKREMAKSEDVRIAATRQEHSQLLSQAVAARQHALSISCKEEEAMLKSLKSDVAKVKAKMIDFQMESDKSKREIESHQSGLDRIKSERLNVLESARRMVSLG